MRKVTVQIWVNPAGKPCGYEPREATFHRWGEELFEQTDGASVSYTVGIVEMEDGAVRTAIPEHIKFNDSPEA